MTLTVTIPRYILDDEDRLCEFFSELEAENGKIKSIKAKGLVHTIIF